MADDWYDGAVVIRAPAGGRMEGPSGVRSVVWHTSESSPHADPAGIARYVIGRSSEYHLVWNVYSGHVVQLLPAGQSARSLRNAGSLRTNRVGDVRIQICVVGRAADNPLASSPLAGWEGLRAWLADWGVPEVDRVDLSRSRTTWARSGHTTHSSAPGNDHTDPGRIDFDRLFGQPTSEEIDMLIIRQGTKSPILIHGSSTTVIDEKSAKSMEKSGVPACKVTGDVYQRFKAQ